MKQNIRKFLVRGLIISVVIVIGIPILVGGSLIIYKQFIWPQRFTEARWQALPPITERNPNQDHSIDFTCQRGRLVNDLIKNHLIPGQINKKQVFAMLGSEGGEILSEDGNNCYSWPIGWCSLMDPDFIRICFDKN
ncbi:MAG TPA: hypothetical protein PKW15_07825, partial [Alphaproteobacteria bacterium]|nr:hypothetical protein [Alphaproteobacteria bacterium]